MSGWTTHSGQALAFDRASVDTDQLIPARFMSTPRAEGYGDFLLFDLRHDEDGALLPDFPLNSNPQASVLVTRENFGSGSSREAAVYALVDFGIRAVFAPSFGDIFASNAVNNGLLPARIAVSEADALIAALGTGTQEARIDLAGLSATIGATTLTFDLDPVWQQKLTHGWDDIDLTQNLGGEIAAYRDRIAATDPWRFPA